jgi:hypothetical protein
MPCLLITYDLNRPGQNYKDLHDEIKAIGTTSWWHYLDSTWMVSTSLSVRQATERLLTKIDKSDRLLVLNVSNDENSGWLTEDAWDWIKQHLDGARVSRY